MNFFDWNNFEQNTSIEWKHRMQRSSIEIERLMECFVMISNSRYDRWKSFVIRQIFRALDRVNFWQLKLSVSRACFSASLLINNKKSHRTHCLHRCRQPSFEVRVVVRKSLSSIYSIASTSSTKLGMGSLFFRPWYSLGQGPVGLLPLIWWARLHDPACQDW